MAKHSEDLTVEESVAPKKSRKAKTEEAPAKRGRPAKDDSKASKRSSKGDAKAEKVSKRGRKPAEGKKAAAERTPREKTWLSGAKMPGLEWQRLSLKDAQALAEKQEAKWPKELPSGKAEGGERVVKFLDKKGRKNQVIVVATSSGRQSFYHVRPLDPSKVPAKAPSKRAAKSEKTEKTSKRAKGEEKTSSKSEKKSRKAAA